MHTRHRRHAGYLLCLSVLPAFAVFAAGAKEKIVSIVIEDFENLGFGRKWLAQSVSYRENINGEDLTLHADTRDAYAGGAAGRIACAAGQRQRFQMVHLGMAEGPANDNNWRYSRTLPGRVQAVGFYAKGDGQTVTIALCKDWETQRKLLAPWDGKAPDSSHTNVTLGPLTPEWKRYFFVVAGEYAGQSNKELDLDDDEALDRFLAEEEQQPDSGLPSPVVDLKEAQVSFNVFQYLEVSGGVKSSGDAMIDDIFVVTALPAETTLHFMAEPFPLELKAATESGAKQVCLTLDNLLETEQRVEITCDITNRWWNPGKFDPIKDRRQPRMENKSMPGPASAVVLPAGGRVKKTIPLAMPAGAWMLDFTARAGDTACRQRLLYTVYPDEMQPMQEFLVAEKLAEKRGFVGLVSDLSPIMLARIAGNRAELFSAGKAGAADAAAGAGAQAPANRAEQPSACAYVSDGRPVVRSMAEFEKEAPLSLSEGWMLFWFRDSAGWNRYGVWGKEAMARLKRALGSEEGPWLDVPVLVFFQHRPQSMKSGPDRVEIAFPAEAGCLGVMPYNGGFVMRPDTTGGWRNGLPAEVLKRCRWWNRVARAYPVNASEKFKCDFGADRITFRTDVEFLSIKDDWGTPELRVAPLWPFLGLAFQAGLPATFDSAPIDPDYPTSVGPWLVVEGESWQFGLDGFLQYIAHVPVYGGAPETEAGRKALELLRNEKLVESIARTEWWFALSSKTIHHTAKALPYLDAGERERLSHAIRCNLMYLLNPSHFYPEYGPRNRRIYNYDGRNFQKYGHSWVDASPSSAEYLRFVWHNANALAEWPMVRDNWPAVAGLFNVCDHATCWNYFDINGGDAVDSTLSGCVAYARMAAGIGNDAEFRYGCYLSVRYFICLYALVKGGLGWAMKNEPYWLPQFGARMTGAEDGALLSGGDSGDRLGSGRWTNAILHWQDIVIAQSDGLSLGFGPWNIPISIRGDESEFRFCRDHCPDFGRHWFDDVIRNYASEYYAAVTGPQRPAGPYLDRRNGKEICRYGAHYEPFCLLARRLIMGETAEKQLSFLEEGSPLRKARENYLRALVDIIAADGGMRFENVGQGRQPSPEFELGKGRDAFVKKPDVCAYNLRNYAEFHYPGYGPGIYFGRIAPAGAAGPPTDYFLREMNWVLEMFCAD